MTNTQLHEEHRREATCDPREHKLPPKLEKAVSPKVGCTTAPPSRNPPLAGCTFYDKMKKVSFSHQILIFDVDSDNQDRKGMWETIGRDRERFKRRIVEVEQKIGWLFNL